jgi:ABC-type bacteriocin/lantibiotic exporter with double-glycine peptidase domain
MTTESGAIGVVRIWSLIWAMIGEFRAIWPKLWWIIPATVFTVLAQLIEPYAYKQIVDILGQSQNSSDLMTQVTPVVLLWAGSVLIAIVVEFLRDYYCHLRMHYYWATVVAR